MLSEDQQNPIGQWLAAMGSPLTAFLGHRKQTTLCVSNINN
jgi:hypothetical protein